MHFQPFLVANHRFFAIFVRKFCFFSRQTAENMYEKTQGIVLHALRYGDDSQIVDILTETRGSVSFLVKMPRSHKSGIKAQLLRPLNILDIELDYRPQRSLQRIREMHVPEPYQTIPYEPMKSVVALFLGEMLYYSLRNEERNDRLFCFLLQSLHWFDMADTDYVNFHLAFLIKMTRYLGFWPNCEDRKSGSMAYFDLTEASFTSLHPIHNECLKGEEADWVPRFLKMNYTTMRFFKMTRQQRNYVLDILCHYYRLHIPDFPEVKSLDILREVVG